MEYIKVICNLNLKLLVNQQNLSLAAASAGPIIILFGILFDRKRPAKPECPKEERERRRLATMPETECKLNVEMAPPKKIPAGDNWREVLCMEHIIMAELELQFGNSEEAIPYLMNAFKACKQPSLLRLELEKRLPSEIYKKLAYRMEIENKLNELD